MPDRGLLKAALSFGEGSEDRLTEVFAAVLAVNLDFARRLFERADPTLPFGDELEVRTQHPLEGCRLDLVAITRSQGHVVAELWSEHKTASGFSSNQLGKYSQALADTGRTGRVISVVAKPAGRPPPSCGRERFLWQDIAEIANESGFAWGNVGWRGQAMQPDAPASMRLLHEFIWYVERERYAVVDALERDDIRVFRDTPRTWPRIQALIEHAASGMGQLTPDGGFESYDDGSWCWQLFEARAGTWAARLGELNWDVYPELSLAADGSPVHANEPAFGAGVSIDARLRDDLGAREDWLTRADEAGFEVVPVDEMLRIYRTKPLAEVIKGDTLGDQATILAEWAEKAIMDALAIDPGEVAPRPVSERKRPDETQREGYDKPPPDRPIAETQTKGAGSADP